MKEDLRKLYNLLFKSFIPVFFAYFSDLLRWMKYSIKEGAGTKKEHLEAKMLLNLHSLEKGLSFKQVKKGFGSQISLSLINTIERYVHEYGVNEIVVLSLGVLKEYIDNPVSGKSKDLVSRFDSLMANNNLSRENLVGGTKLIKKDINLNYDISFDTLYSIAKSRSSIRDFSAQKPITDEEIKNALKYAQTAPSVCNRQPWRLHCYHENLDEILDTQLGNQGWAQNANKLFVVTSDLNFFGSPYERNQAYIDGGMFSMQFVMGLHYQKIATCCKMYIRLPKLDKLFYSVTNIPKNEVPIMLILAGHYKEEEVKVPYSFRFKQIKQH